MSRPKGEETKQSRTRKRTTTVSHACTACREKHLKCDGRKPVCGRCVAKGLTCDWNRKKRKRGPVAGKTARLEHQVKSLIGEVKQYSSASEHWKELYEAMKATKKVNSSLWTIAEPLAPPEVLAAYVQYFIRDVNPLFNISLTEFTDTAKIKQVLYSEVPSPVTLKLCGVLSGGARRSGCSDHARDFAQKCRLVLCDFFDLNHPDVACGLALLASDHMCTGDYSKAVYYNSMAVNMCKNLLKQMPPTSAQFRQIGDIYRICTLSLAEMADSRQEALDTFLGLSSWLEENFFQRGMTDDTTINLQYLWAQFSFITYKTTSCRFSKARWGERPNDGPVATEPTELNKLLEIVDPCIGILQQLQNCPAWKYTGLHLANALKARVLINLRRTEEGRALADSVLVGFCKLPEDQRGCAWAVTVMHTLALIHSELGDHQKCEKDCAILQTLSKSYPLVTNLVHLIRASRTPQPGNGNIKIEPTQQNLYSFADSGTRHVLYSGTAYSMSDQPNKQQGVPEFATRQQQQQQHSQHPQLLPTQSTQPAQPADQFIRNSLVARKPQLRHGNITQPLNTRGKRHTSMQYGNQPIRFQPSYDANSTNNQPFEYYPTM